MSALSHTGTMQSVASLATRQHGIVSRGQLRSLGFSNGQIKARVRSGVLITVFPTVFAVGHTSIGPHGRMAAAVLACGEGTVVSHGTAASLLDLWEREPTLVHVISPGEAGRRIEGIRWHRAPPVRTDERTARYGVPCTSVARTLVDLAGGLGRASLSRLVEAAAVQRHLDVEDVERVLARRRRRGAPVLRQIVKPWRATAACPPLLRSTLEARLLRELIERGFPRPKANVGLNVQGTRLEVDFLWETQRVVLEADGRRTHATSAAFGRDRRRDQILGAAGYRVSRVTWDQLEEEPDAVFSRIRRMLGS